MLNCFFAFLIACFLDYLPTHFSLSNDYIIHCLKLGWSSGMVDGFLNVVVDGLFVSILDRLLTCECVVDWLIDCMFAGVV